MKNIHLIIRAISLSAILGMASPCLAEYLKIADPRDSKDSLILTNYSCTKSTDMGLMEFGIAMNKESMNYQIAGCYKMNDQDGAGVVTFYIINNEIKTLPISYTDIAIIDINTDLPSPTLKFDSRKNRLIAEKAQRSDISLLALKKFEAKIPVRTGDVAKSTQQTLAANSKPESQNNSRGSTGKVVGMALDRKANANIFLYEAKCNLAPQAQEYPYRWDAKSTFDGISIGQGCYSLNKETKMVFMVSSIGKFISLPLAAFQSSSQSIELEPNQAIFRANKSNTEPQTTKN